MILVNSNPATIMTDPEFATATYIEPLLPGPVAQIIARERPDALLPTLGGQTALNLAETLHEDGTLERYGVELIGANYDAIRRAEDRDLFRETMHRRPGCACRAARSRRNVAEALRGARARSACRRSCGPAFTLGGQGGGIARTREEYERIVAGGHRRLADRPGAGRGVGARLGRVRARGDARPQRQRRDRLLDRERRPDGRPHRRLGDGRAAAEPQRRHLPACCATRRSP